MKLENKTDVETADIYPRQSERAVSPGHTTYYIDPAEGCDMNSGLQRAQAWRSFVPINRLVLAAGDRVEITAPGHFEHTLVMTGAGSEKTPIAIHFAPGRYDFFPSNALRRKYQISNTNGDPYGEKAIGILFDGARHITLSGPGACLVSRGKMIDVCIDNSESISIFDLQFDYHRPTVSEFRVTALEAEQVDIDVHKDSTYEITEGRITWIGEGWDHEGGLAQALNVETDELWRCHDPLEGLTLVEVEPRHIRATGKHSMKLDHVYQIRNPWRDYAGMFTRRSKDILWKNVSCLFLHGMGMVNQFSENLTFENVSIAPDPDSGRTTAAWADGIQVSGCRGRLVVKNCVFSGAHDDAINIHGTHLQVVQQVAERQIRVKFMHGQTFGFMAFNPGDEMMFVHWDSLETYGPNVVVAADMLNPEEMLLTLAHPVPAALNERDAVENITWTPDVTITGCDVRRIPTRGFLITTRRKVLVEENTFHLTRMSGILVENDAQGWFESGPVRDMTIRHNRFFHCGEPVIKISPKNSVPNSAVHEHIRIEGNHIALKGTVAVHGQSTKGLAVVGNTIYSDQALADEAAILTTDCAEVQVEGNRFLPSSAWIFE